MIVYLSHGFLNAQQPAWVPQLKAAAPAVLWYDQLTSLRRILEVRKQDLVQQLLEGQQHRSFWRAREFSTLLSLPTDLFLPPEEMLPKLIEAEEHPMTVETVQRALYLLVRARAVLVDLDALSYGDRGAETWCARQLGIPVLGVTSRFVVDPWLASTCSQIRRPDPADILQGVRCLDGGNERQDGPGQPASIDGEPDTVDRADGRRDGEDSGRSPEVRRKRVRKAG